MVHQQHRVSVCHKVPALHRPTLPGSRDAARWRARPAHTARRWCGYAPRGQLHALALACGECGSGAAQRKVAEAQPDAVPPPGTIHKCCAPWAASLRAGQRARRSPICTALPAAYRRHRTGRCRNGQAVRAPDQIRRAVPPRRRSSAFRAFTRLYSFEVPSLAFSTAFGAEMKFSSAAWFPNFCFAGSTLSESTSG